VIAADEAVVAAKQGDEGAIVALVIG